MSNPHPNNGNTNPEVHPHHPPLNPPNHYPSYPPVNPFAHPYSQPPSFWYPPLFSHPPPHPSWGHPTYPYSNSMPPYHHQPPPVLSQPTSQPNATPDLSSMSIPFTPYAATPHHAMASTQPSVMPTPHAIASTTAIPTTAIEGFQAATPTTINGLPPTNKTVLNVTNESFITAGPQETTDERDADWPVIGML
ncbi:uncharacterized protein MELLADRAFT_61654 [Melampsora larici-populina 98AG31]|uniref:Uncharacterized protein n=1 Tax=Melampsora larici-populina (strain 98AG31 / pathotype 3-4-7) TaxID=747676 RepID=F4RFS9_MELLP|nr:uncharacterized protein MELLADRAFT_61654 [Melampsora larici-populina 98AG31]EGG08861.1 hypothetical protein MELLADRAFT_61654 [Melampsora larici-populina 98AG31]